ncbi:alpha-L-arabinofuranosidase C-terminal domain-containing protein [Bifidobacterium sp. SO4]|uniref:alpha-L-arabinofuranosidase C-terminal domain-containing protein n=1 Tax=Bifidobacterium sp. SO4 TaxID=2809030 RepID=UPI001C2F7697|nr:alpha-L-arabinofuranosidase C-terminal domain-containing protein [Bifidobacterium sp. SO4]
MVRISVGAPTHHTSGRLYGVFFEDINHSADGGLNANMVNNYSFDGVYLDHHTWRLAGADRWRTQADPLRFWRFSGCSAISCGIEIRGAHGQIVDTSMSCPAPPIHAHSRYARVIVDEAGGDNAMSGDNVRTADNNAAPASSAAFIENLGYNGGGANGEEPAFSITDGHAYDVSLCVRPVSEAAVLSVAVVDRSGRPLTDAMRITIDGLGGAVAADDATVTALADGWWRVTGQVHGLATDYGKLRIGIGSGDAADNVRINDAAADGTGGRDDAATVASPIVFDLDLVQVMDADYWGAGDPKWRYGKLRRDLVEAIGDLHPAFMRFPGGCIVEGVTPGNEYRWKDTVGALQARRAQYSMWSFKMPDGSSYCQSYQIGFYEYFCLCEDLGAKPLPTLFAGIACQSPGRDPRHMDIDSAAFRQNVVQDYLDLIEFANGDPETSPWAAVRRDMGHPEPFGLDMIGVGNENFGADYVAKFDRISTAIHERYPHMLCVMSAGLFPFQPAMKRTWDHARAIAGNARDPKLGAVGSATGDAVLVDEHSYHSPEWFESQATRFDRYPRCGAGVYFGEYSANGYFAGQPQTEEGANTWRSALGEAAFLTGCERNSDVVRMTSYAPLLAHIPAKGWAQNLIEFNPAHVNPTVNYEVERLFAAHLGPETYDVTVENVETAKHLYVSVTGSDGGDATGDGGTAHACATAANIAGSTHTDANGTYRYIKIVNTGGDAVDVTLEIAHGLAGLTAKHHGPVRLDVETLTAAPDAKTVIGYRGEATEVIERTARTYTLPSPSSLLAMKIRPYSVTLVISR